MKRDWAERSVTLSRLDVDGVGRTPALLAVVGADVEGVVRVRLEVVDVNRRLAPVQLFLQSLSFAPLQHVLVVD